MNKLPYLASPGNIPRAFSQIKIVATPPRVSQDFVKTKLGITGSSGDQITSFLKRIGFAEPDGSPSELYRAYRTTDKAGWAAAEGFKIAYAPLYSYNEYLHDCDDTEIKDIVIRYTGLDSNSRPLSLIVTTIRNLLSLADFEHDAGKVVSVSQKGSTGIDDEVADRLPPQKKLQEEISAPKLGSGPIDLAGAA